MFTSASFIVTERCNLACSYCFENGRRGGADMSEAVAVRGMEWLFENALKSGADRVSVILFGGEPLLLPEICDTILAHGAEFSRWTGIRFEPSIITNATVLTERAAEMLQTAAEMIPSFHCQLSIDGAEKSQNLYRVFPDGRGSFEAVQGNVERFRQIFGRRLNIHGCINKMTMPMLFENYRYVAEQWKPGSIWFMPVHTEQWSEWDISLYDEQLGRVFEHQTQKLGTVSYFAPMNKLLTCRPGREAHHAKTCGAGVSFCSVTGDGSLYPCHNIYFNDPSRSMRFGDVFRGVLENEKLMPFEWYTYQSLGCEGCKNTACYRCIADNWVHNGDITKQVGKPMRCLLSCVERKWQEKAREYAGKHFGKEMKSCH